MNATVTPMKPLHPVLDIVDLSISLPSGADRALAVEGATLSVLPGQTLCVVGESGSGKSMIANAVMGLLPRPHVAPVAGRILFDGHDLLQLTEPQMRELRGRRIGMVFQEPMTALNPVMRIGEQIGEVFDAHGSVPAAEKRRRILAALADVGLPDPELLIDAYPFRLSGGQRQRVMIACALVLEPVLLIADEPTTALDVTTQAQILDLIRELQAERGTAVILITHDLGVVAETADDIVVMYAARIAEHAPVFSLFERPMHPYTWGLLGSLPRLDVELERLTQIKGQPPSLLRPPAGCRFRPRCAHAFDRCRSELPEATPAGFDAGHLDACFLAEVRKLEESARIVADLGLDEEAA